MTIRVVSWNIAANRGISSRRLGAILGAIASLDADVVLLQEVLCEPNCAERHLLALAAIGYGSTVYSGARDAVGKKYGNVIAARRPLTPIDEPWRVPPPWPQLVARARLDVDGKEVDIVNVHIPNGSGNGWKKIETFEAVADYLRAAPAAPRVLGGDFNEPRELLPTGEIIPFGQKRLQVGTSSWAGMKTDKFDESHPRTRWRDGVLSVLAGEACHGLRHAFNNRHGFESEPTFLTSKNPRWFDHILVSRHFEGDRPLDRRS